MVLRARILLIISISSLVLYLSVEGLNILPSIAQPNCKFNEVNHSEKDQGSTRLDEPKDASRPVSGPAPSPTSLWGGISEVIEEAHKTISPVTSSIVNEAEAISSSIFGGEIKTSSPFPAPFSGLDPYPVLGPAPSPFLGPDFPSSPGMGPASSPFSGPAPYPNSPSFSPGLGPGPGQSPGFFDHDVALAIEARIKQSQTDAQLAMDEAKKLLDDPAVASSEAGMCLSKCIDKYGASLSQLNRAIMDLGVRDVTLLADDFGAVEMDISTCQACFTENIGEDSPLKALEEATTKAARECLTVMDYAA